MPELIQYLLKVSLSLSVGYLFYSCVLRSLTFYTWNRWYFVVFTCLSFVVPSVDVATLINSQSAGPDVVAYIPSIEQVTTAAMPIRSISKVTYDTDIWWLLQMLMIAGSAIMAIRMLLQVLSLSKIRSQATVIEYKGCTLYDVDKAIPPFSFGNAIYVNKRQHNAKELEDIILHEHVHVKQHHTMDMVLAEVLCIVCWYNPFAWLIRESIKQNLEFIADDQVLQLGMDRKSYQYHLLNVVGITQYNIANPFNFSSLKKRIQMMNKIKNNRIHLIKFLFMLPVMAVVLFAFRQQTQPDQSKINYAIIFYDLDTKEIIPGVSVSGIHDKRRYAANAEGYVSIPYSPVDKKLHVSVLFTKQGYYTHDRRFQYPLRGEVSIIEVIGLRKSNNAKASNNRFLATMSSSPNTGRELENDARNFYLWVINSLIPKVEASHTVVDSVSSGYDDKKLLYVINPDRVDQDDFARARDKFQRKGISLNVNLDYNSSELRIALKSEKSQASAIYNIAELKRLNYLILVRADPATKEVSVVSEKR